MDKSCTKPRSLTRVGKRRRFRMAIDNLRSQQSLPAPVGPPSRTSTAGGPLLSFMLAMRSFRRLLRKELVFALFGAAATVGLVATPYRITLDGFLPKLLVQTAIAKGGHGNGNGNSNSANKGGGNNSGQSGGHGHSNSNKNSGGVSGTPSNEYVNPATGNRIKVNGSNIEVVHPDGITEEIANGRYEMSDAKGRTIIKRPVTGADRARLRTMIGG
jgi:hypothetical protein